MALFQLGDMLFDGAAEARHSIHCLESAIDARLHLRLRDI
jgi:hypothetical protein